MRWRDWNKLWSLVIDLGGISASLLLSGPIRKRIIQYLLVLNIRIGRTNGLRGYLCFGTKQLALGSVNWNVYYLYGRSSNREDPSIWDEEKGPMRLLYDFSEDSLWKQIATTISSDMRIFYYPVQWIYTVSLMQIVWCSWYSGCSTLLNSYLGSSYHPYIVLFWSKIAILPRFRSSILFHGARVQNRNQQVFPRLYRPANPVPLNPLPFSWPHIFTVKEYEIFLLLHKWNVSFHPGKATSFSTNNVLVI